MKWLRQLWLKIRQWLLPRQLLKVVEVEELPERLHWQRVYLVGENGYWWYVALLCPCGCGERIHLNLLPEQRPCWRVDRHADGTVSVEPSIWRIRGCGSHFFLRRGGIKWCVADGDRTPGSQTL